MLRKQIAHGPTTTSSRVRNRQSFKVRSQTYTTATKSAPPRPQLTGEARSHETDIVVIGSGVGGLCCGGLLAKYGYKVRVKHS